MPYCSSRKHSDVPRAIVAAQEHASLMEECAVQAGPERSACMELEKCEHALEREPITGVGFSV